MNTWKIVAIILAIGASFNVVGTYAADVDCTATQPHVSAGPVCMDLTDGPRFTVRR